MRILVVSQYFWPEDFRINELVKDFKMKGHDIVVLTGVPNYPEGKIFSDYKRNKSDFSELDGCQIIRVPIIPRGKNKISLFLNYLSFIFLGSIYGLFKVSRFKFDSIFVFEPSPIFVCLPAILIKWYKKIPLTLWVLDLWPQTLTAVGLLKEGGIAVKILSVLVKFIYRNCDLILGQSKSFVKEISKYCDKEEKVKYFPNWYEDIYSQSNYLPAPEITKQKSTFDIIFAGNIGDAQDFPTIIKAMELIRPQENIRLIVIGEGRRYQWLKDIVKSKNLESKVILLGRFPNTRMPEFFLHADAFLVSLRPHEIFDKTIPGKLQSYLISRKPVIGMLRGDGKNVIENSGCGFNVNPGNHNELYETILHLSKLDKNQLSRFGINGFNYAIKNFNKEVIYKDLEVWLSELKNPLSSKA
tara:strand:+ start:15 stop:1253 length:1239 start_codon:yes stop_codon:yes gene_type:complete